MKGCTLDSKDTAVTSRTRPAVLVASRLVVSRRRGIQNQGVCTHRDSRRRKESAWAPRRTSERASAAVHWRLPSRFCRLRRARVRAGAASISATRRPVACFPPTRLLPVRRVACPGGASVSHRARSLVADAPAFGPVGERKARSRGLLLRGCGATD